jgi:hypothetical protein
MKSLRDWATPLTIGIFALMGVTGLLMFFESATRLNKTIHEWGGLIMVAAVVTHVIVNWLPFKRYLASSNMARGIVAACVLVLAMSFAPLTGSQDGGRPTSRLITAVLNAPLEKVAVLQGVPGEQLIADLAKAGITVTDLQQSLATLTKGDRELQDEAVAALFGAKTPTPAP